MGFVKAKTKEIDHESIAFCFLRFLAEDNPSTLSFQITKEGHGCQTTVSFLKLLKELLDHKAKNQYQIITVHYAPFTEKLPVNKSLTIKDNLVNLL